MRRLLTAIMLAGILPDAAFSGDISPQGKPEQKLVKVDTARYFVWQDSEGWHLRTASRGLVKFTGSITLSSGTFGKLRTAGLEKKGKYPDQWELNGQRNKVLFEVFTSNSFDGFDFDVRGKEAAVEFELKIGKEARSMPKRIFIGADNAHPEQVKFSFPAEPTGQSTD